MDAAVIENISKMPVNGNRLELPKNEQFSNYPAVKKCLITAGAKYVKCGFVFPEDAQIVKSRLIGGEVINDKKKFQFFTTPPDLARKLVDMADLKPWHKVLEPSAGQGAICDLIRGINIYSLAIVELSPENRKILEKKGYCLERQHDFMRHDKVSLGEFDRIIANPPFTKNQDIDHIQHMYKFLVHGGKLVSMASPSWRTGSQKKQVAFREWLESVDAIVTDVDAGAFKSSGTQIATVIIEITK